ncbi:saccharopine dehydrogenase family protein [Paraliomyxa miuraensis]|uniref:saccharopine dehydrogenase family protein n=1 Tax=Paraliomyxa miuraensis TaxID=376150 RepID=UPI002258F827|nr:saccharopine dehydrogenase NADP-binding domain-containing protein [Paraliomyxa miuraensis]MCX4242766.1 saccharopine dehydrogenase NADP-binding domain-containing protein [Paraliomyxa miuraensis]
MDTSARHDIILFGATGFTGGLVAEYLAQTLEPGQLSWALAGRDVRKLRRVREALAATNPAWAELPLYQGLSSDSESLRDLAARTRVMLTTVGPYASHGEPLVAACVAEGCDYVDLTGEPTFWKGVIDRHHGEAAAKGLRLVSCCGFDSIPHDLGVLYTVDRLREHGGEGPIEIDGFVRAHGGFSGGTLASALQAMAELRPGASSGRSAPSHGPGGTRSRPRIHFESAIGRWVVPMPTIDPLVVERSTALIGEYELRYGHYMAAKSLPRLAALMAGVGTVFALAKTPARHLLERLRPSGSGPSEEQRAKGWFVVTFVGRQGQASVTTEVRGGDPGYGHTAKMIAEAARCLAEDRDRLPARHGVLTPAAAMGEVLIERLRQTGMEFTVRA